MNCATLHSGRRPHRRSGRATTSGIGHAAALFAALVSLMPACGAEADAETSVLVQVLIADERYRPEYLLVQWFSPDGAARPVERVPAVGYLPVKEAELATIELVLRDEPGERRLVVKGMRNGIAESMAATRVPWTPRQRQRLSLTLGELLSDADDDGLPDTIDD